VEKTAPANPVLAANLKKLMAARSIEKLRSDMAEQGIAIGTETIHRATLGKSGNRLESLAKIATFFSVTVDQLLQPDLGADLDAWPFSPELYTEVRRLDDPGRASLEMAMWGVLTVLKKDRPVQAAFDEPTTDERQSNSTHAAPDIMRLGNPSQARKRKAP